MKPTVDDLGIDVNAQAWQRSGDLELAFVEVTGALWVLCRVAGDPSDRVLVYNRSEWECFVDGVKDGEFDDAIS